MLLRPTVLSVAQPVDGETAQVTVKARFHYKRFPKPVSTVFTDRLYARIAFDSPPHL